MNNSHRCGHDTERILAALTSGLFEPARNCLNEGTLPVQFSLFNDDVVPTNQANLTDIRTRMGVLLEYELGKAIAALVPPHRAQNNPSPM